MSFMRENVAKTLRTKMSLRENVLLTQAATNRPLTWSRSLTGWAQYMANSTNTTKYSNSAISPKTKSWKNRYIAFVSLISNVTCRKSEKNPRFLHIFFYFSD